MNQKKLERYVLRISSYMIDKRPDIFSTMKEEYFTGKDEKIAFRAMSTSAENGEFNMVSVCELAESMGMKNSFTYISEIMDIEVEPGGADNYIDVLTRKGLKKIFSGKVAELHAACEDGHSTTKSIRDRLIAICETPLEPREADGEEMFSRALDTINRDQMCGTARMDIGIPEMSMYYPASEYLVIIAARPSVGKTMMAINIAGRLSASGTHCAMYSMEMSAMGIIRRVAAMRSGIPLHKFMDVGGFSNQEMDKVSKTINDMKGGNFRIIPGKWGYGELCSSILSEKRRNPQLKCVLIDHVGLVKFNAINRYDLEVGKLTGRLAAMCKELNMCVVLLSQMNRGNNETRDSFSIDRMKDSGKLEEDADEIWMLDRKKNVTVHIAKNRDGPTGVVDLDCDITTGRIGKW